MTSFDLNERSCSPISPPAFFVFSALFSVQAFVYLALAFYCFAAETLPLDIRISIDALKPALWTSILMDLYAYFPKAPYGQINWQAFSPHSKSTVSVSLLRHSRTQARRYLLAVPSYAPASSKR